jgi:hypothetical protein
VFHVKADGTFRARIVMMGQFMVRGLHYGKTFAPTPSATVVKVFVAITAREKRSWVEFDVRGAFLTQKLPADTPVDIILPPGFNDSELGSPEDVSDGLRRRCFRAIPGCPNGSRLFYQSMKATLTAGGFVEVSPEYPCLYKDSFKPCLWVLVWVDNLYVNPIPGVHDSRVVAFQRMLETAYPSGITSSDRDSTSHHMLGSVLENPRPGLFFLHQKPFLEEVLRKASMDATRPVDTPVAAGFLFTQADCPSSRRSEPAMNDRARIFRSVVMSTNYALEWSRPDFSYVQSKLAKFMHCPGERHFKALKRFLRYIKGTLDKGLVFDFSSDRVPRPFVYGFFDAAHTDDVDTRRSTLAYVFFWAGVPIAYKTKLHTFITTSTNHSELVAASSACRVAKALWKLFSALGFDDQVTPIDLFTDSMGCLFISHGEGTSASLRHIELADFFARECISRGIVTMTHVATGRMIADPLTKPLPAPSFRELTKFLVGTVVGRDLSPDDFSSFPPLSSQVRPRQSTSRKDVGSRAGLGGLLFRRSVPVFSQRMRKTTTPS